MEVQLAVTFSDYYNQNLTQIVAQTVIFDPRKSRESRVWGPIVLVRKCLIFIVLQFFNRVKSCQNYLFFTLSLFIEFFYFSVYFRAKFTRKEKKNNFMVRDTYVPQDLD